MTTFNAGDRVRIKDEPLTNMEGVSLDEIFDHWRGQEAIVIRGRDFQGDLFISFDGTRQYIAEDHVEPIRHGFKVGDHAVFTQAYAFFEAGEEVIIVSPLDQDNEYLVRRPSDPDSGQYVPSYVLRPLSETPVEFKQGDLVTIADTDLYYTETSGQRYPLDNLYRGQTARIVSHEVDSVGDICVDLLDSMQRVVLNASLLTHLEPEVEKTPDIQVGTRIKAENKESGRSTIGTVTHSEGQLLVVNGMSVSHLTDDITVDNSEPIEQGDIVSFTHHGRTFRGIVRWEAKEIVYENDETKFLDFVSVTEVEDIRKIA